MAFHIRITHHTNYRYEKPVSFSPHFVRLFPRTEPGRLAHKIAFATNPAATVQYRRDFFDNVYARCYYPEKQQTLEFGQVIDLDLEEYNPFNFLLENYASEFPFSYQPGEAGRLAPYLQPPAGDSQTDPAGKLLPLGFWQAPTKPCSTVSMLVDLVGAMHQSIAYERRDEGVARSPQETLRLGSGACRDTSVLLAAVLRELGLAARLVSGYLCELRADNEFKRADGAMHMWTEVYLPGAGWTGMDPTNGNFCDHNFIATAVGLTTAEIMPVSGFYYGQEIVPAAMTATLELTPR